MTSRDAVGRSSKRSVVLSVVLCAILASAALQAAQADTGMVVGHVAPASAREGHDLMLPALVQSTCIVGSCGPIRFVVVYQVPEGSTFRVVMLPAKKTQLAGIMIPGVDVRAPRIVYRLAAYQQRCVWHCSTASGETITYTVPVRRG